MLDTQEMFFRNEITSSFATNNQTTVVITSYSELDSLEPVLRFDDSQYDLIKIPYSKAWELVRNNQIKPLDEILTPAEMNRFGKDFVYTSLGRKHSHQYFIPRKFETRIMIYLKSKVLEAWIAFRDNKIAINEDLKKYNSYGLPKDYRFERNPERWDFFDLFVVGWLWSHNDSDTIVGAKIAHRAKYYTGTAQRVIDRVYQLGGDSTAVVNMDGDAVLDAFHWEAVYQAAGIYNPKMVEEKWDGKDIWKGFKQGEVYLSFMTQIDCFFLHGTKSDKMNGYLKNPDDMGIVTMPRGCSMQISEDGEILRMGSKTISTGGWFWGIPKTSKNPRKAFEFANYITSPKIQIIECSSFGMIPVRRNIANNLNTYFQENWIREVFETSYRQIVYNHGTVIPAHQKCDAIVQNYLNAWTEIVANKKWSNDNLIPDRTYIKFVLDLKYSSFIQKFLL